VGWSGTDIVPGTYADAVLFEDIGAQRRTYGAIAQAILADIKRKIAA
jgi:hypothetical protein